MAAKVIFATLALVMVTGCQSTVKSDSSKRMVRNTDSSNRDSSLEASCVNHDLSHLLGKPIGDLDSNDLLEEFSVDLVRVVYPDQAVTMDYRTDRLSISVDDSGVISRATCG